jgi:hypothetical protein
MQDTLLLTVLGPMFCIVLPVWAGSACTAYRLTALLIEEVVACLELHLTAHDIHDNGRVSSV